MKKNQKIIFISLIFSSIAFICTAGGSQESTPPDSSPQSSEQSASKSTTLPSGKELTVLRLRYFVENAEYEPSLALNEEQVLMILPIIKDWKTAVEEDNNADSSQFVDSIIAELTEKQASFLPPPPNAGSQSGSADRPRLSDGQRPPKGQRSPEVQRPSMDAVEDPISIPEMLTELIELLSAMV